MLDGARYRESGAVALHRKWQAGWLFRRVFKKRFSAIAEAAEEATARRMELVEQEALARLNTEIEIPEPVAQAFHRMCDDFSVMSRARKIWDTVSTKNVNQFVERTTAARAVEREPVSFRLGKCDLLASSWNVPHLANANGGDIFLYPGFMLYFVSAEAFALLEHGDAKVEYNPQRFHEEEAVPGDSKVVGQTWAKANKDGTPDRRFKDNYPIPIVEYGKLRFTSTTGMNEEYMVSDAARAAAFVDAWKQLGAAVAQLRAHQPTP